MNDETLTSVLLSGAARDIEAVAETRDDLSPEERQEVAELVASCKDLHERLSYSSSLRDGATRADAVDRLRRILEDNRYHYEPAEVQVNSPLALIQAGLSGKAEVYGWLAGVEVPGQGDLEPGEWDGFEEDETEVEV